MGRPVFAPAIAKIGTWLLDCGPLANPNSIDTGNVFITALANGLPAPNTTFAHILSSMDQVAKGINPQVSKDALANAHGNWFEWMLAICAWNARQAFGKTGFVATLPNITGFDCAQLYQPQLYQMIQHLRAEVGGHNVSLITSNPDFVILEADANIAPPNLPATIQNNINQAVITSLDQMYLAYTGSCSFTSIVGYISAKNTLRPDRRLQMAHEGSLMKALYAHLQTRLWVTNPKGLKYYGLTTRVTNADATALRTIATHSIPDVNATPQRAVDHLYQLVTINDALTAFGAILP